MYAIRSYYAFTPVQLREHVPGAQAPPREQDHAVEPQVGQLAHEVQLVVAFRSYNFV